MFAAVTELPEFPAPTVDLVLPELTAPPVLRALLELTVRPVLREWMASQAPTERLADVAPPALRERKAQKDGPETVNVVTARIYSARHTKLAASSVLPVPLYFAT